VRNKYAGKISIGIAAFSLILATFSVYMKSVAIPSSHMFLSFADRMGWVKLPALQSMPEIKLAGMMSFTDERLVQIASMYAAYTALVGLFYVWKAEKDSEPTLLLSVGAICSCLSLLALNQYAGFIAVSVILGCLIFFKNRSVLGRMD
jgi:hypothetical protein